VNPVISPACSIWRLPLALTCNIKFSPRNRRLFKLLGGRNVGGTLQYFGNGLNRSGRTASAALDATAGAILTWLHSFLDFSADAEFAVEGCPPGRVRHPQKR
jgi:hypothetical protein